MANFPANAALIDNPNTYVEGPLRLTSVIPIKALGPHEILSGVQYEIDACGFDFNEIDFDDFNDCIRTAEKTFDEGLLYVESIGDLSLYTALKCRPGAIGGGDEDSYRARAERRLARLESGYLETKLDAYVLAEGTSVTAEGDLVTAIAALLEKSSLVNNPVLHLSIGLAFQLATRIDSLAEFGVTLVVSPFYTDDRAFLTGVLNIWGTETQVTSVPDDDNNYIMALAERQYLLAVECESYYVAVSS